MLVVALTRLDPNKRIDDLIAATARLPDDPPWHLAVVGATSVCSGYATGVEALARQRLGDRVTFAGRREDVAEVLNAADLMAHTGTVEGTPLVVLEAQACGTPVVAYRMGGVPELVDGVTGLLAPPPAVPDLPDRIWALIGDAGRRARMGEAARSHVVANHCIEAQIEHHAALLATLLAPSARQRRRSSM